MSDIKHVIKRFISYIYPSFRKRGDYVILTYHSINPGHKFSIKPEVFEKQIKYLSENFNIVSLDGFYDDDVNIKRQLAITFDDGFEDNYLYAFPVLKKYAVPATIFITSDFVFGGLDITKDWKVYNGLKPLNLSQIQEMRQVGVSFGSHGKTHSRLSILNSSDLLKEISESKKTIEINLGCNITSFAYPFGQKKDLNINSFSIIKDAGYSIVCTNMWGVNKLEVNDYLNLKRIEINYLDNYRDFVSKVNGRWNFISFFQKLKNLI